MPRKDPIVEEVHAVREAIARSLSCSTSNVLYTSGDESSWPTNTSSGPSSGPHASAGLIPGIRSMASLIPWP